ncbi:MAG: ChuX/HutX family heme-like substrate-binding protein [Pseudomonadota bacterium]
MRKHKGTACHLIDGGLTPFLMLASDFYDARSTTIGKNSFMTDRGIYGAVQFAGDALDVSSSHMNLRLGFDVKSLDNGCALAISNLAEDDMLPEALHLFRGDGEIVHRSDLLNDDDVLIAHAAQHSLPSWTGSATFIEAENRNARNSSNVIELAPFLNTHNKWASMSLEDHLDDIIKDGGQQRSKSMQHIGIEYARPINPKVVPHFLVHLARIKLPFTRIVIQRSIAQLHSGAIDDLNAFDQMMFVHAGKSLLVLDIPTIHSCWAVSYKRYKTKIESLEFYAEDGACVGVIFSDCEGQPCQTKHWNDLVYSLPTKD